MLGILAIAALAGNILALVLFPEGGYLPASIAVLLATRMFGTGYGLLVALLANSYLLVFAPFSLSVLLWMAEPVIVGMLFVRGVKNLLTADLFFWLFFGFLLRFLPDVYLLGAFPQEAVRMALLQILNGGANALAAAFLYELFLRSSWQQRTSLTFIESELNILAACFLIPVSLVILLNLWGPNDLVGPGMEDRLRTLCLERQAELYKLQEQLTEKMDELSASAAQSGLQARSLAGKTARLRETTPELLLLMVTDLRGTTLFSSGRGDLTSRQLSRLQSFAAERAAALVGEKPSLPAVRALSDPQSPQTGFLLLVQPIRNRQQLVGLVAGIIDSQTLNALLQKHPGDDHTSLFLADPSGRLLAGSEPFKPGGLIGELSSLRENPRQRELFAWRPDTHRLTYLTPALERTGLLRNFAADSPYLLVAEFPRAVRRHHLQKMVLSSMAIMLLPALPALFIFLRIERKVMSPFQQLARATDNLPEKIRSRQEVDWPTGHIAEFNTLCETIRDSCEVMRHSFEELENVKESSSRMLEEVLAQHRWEIFSNTRQLSKERSQRQRVEQLIANIEAAETKYRFLIEKTLVGVFFIQEDRFTYVNPRFAEIFAYGQQEIMENLTLRDLVHPDDQVFVSARYLEQINGPPGNNQQFEFRGIRKGGSVIHVEVLNGQGSSNGKPAIIGTLLDVTKRQEAEQTIHHMAFHDPLTELPNRLLFADRLQQLLVRAHRTKEIFALLFIDLDRFKQVNDSLGHLAGDAILKEAGARLTNCLRESDTVSRFGGDEFNVLVSQVHNEDEVVLVAHKILKALQWPYRFDDQEIFLSGSIGIALYPKDGMDAATLTKNADRAMYRAKDLGKNNYQLYSSSMNSRALERMALEASLRKVFEHQELRVYYQPQVSLETGRIVGVEALLRWQHPSGRMISPSMFVPLAEETGLIVPMGEWILRAACFQLKEWLGAGHGRLRIGVNVSSQQFQQSNLPELVSGILRETGLPADCLNLEITETMVMSNVHEAIEILETLREVGVTIAIDDFGTGFSSLSYLKDFPADHLKIDRAFVQNLPYSRNEANIARHIVELAHGLNLKVIAEGVERSQQLHFLKQIGCDEIQGFHISKPLPPEELTLLLEQDRVFGMDQEEADLTASSADG